MLTFVNEMRGRAPASTLDEDQEEEEQHPDPDEDHHDDLHRGRAHQQAVQGTSIKLRREKVTRYIFISQQQLE